MGLKAPPRSMVSAHFFDKEGGFHDLIPPLHRTGTGNHDRPATLAYMDSPNVNNCILRMKVAGLPACMVWRRGSLVVLPAVPESCCHRHIPDFRARR